MEGPYQLTEASQARYEERLRQFFAESSVPATIVVQDKALSLTDPGLANFHHFQALDHTLARTFGFGVSKFVPSRRCQKLSPTQRRFWIEPASLPDAL